MRIIVVNLKTAVVAGVLAAGLCLAPAARADSLGTASSEGIASVKISQMISIAKTASAANGGNLNFGEIYSPPSADTVTMTTAGVREAGNDNILGNDADVSPASFTVNGEPSNSFNISPIPDTEISDGGGNFMEVTDFTPSLAGSGTLTDGIYTFTIGATLHVAADQPPGVYAGTFDVTVNYN